MILSLDVGNVLIDLSKVVYITTTIEKLTIYPEPEHGLFYVILDNQLSIPVSTENIKLDTFIKKWKKAKEQSLPIYNIKLD